MVTTEKADAVHVNFTDLLAKIRKGQAVFDASQKLEELVAAVRETNKGGELTLKLKIKPLTVGDGSTVTILDDCKLKLPEATVANTIMFTTKNNTLQREDPRQMESDVD